MKTNRLRPLLLFGLLALIAARLLHLGPTQSLYQPSTAHDIGNIVVTTLADTQADDGVCIALQAVKALTQRRVAAT